MTTQPDDAAGPHAARRIFDDLEKRLALSGPEARADNDRPDSPPGQPATAAEPPD